MNPSHPIKWKSLQDTADTSRNPWATHCGSWCRKPIFSVLLRKYAWRKEDRASGARLSSSLGSTLAFYYPIKGAWTGKQK